MNSGSRPLRLDSYTGALLRLACLVLAVLWLTPPLLASEDKALEFIDEMLGGIDAKTVECPGEVLEQVETRAMNVICAKFDGHFELFQPRWDAYHQREFASGLGLPKRDDSGTPRTDWLADGTRYLRIYSLRDTVIGVRFQDGELLVFYK